MSDPLHDNYVSALEEENEALRARLVDLEREFGFYNTVPLIFGLTGSEEKVLSLLGARDVASKQQIMTALMVYRGGDEEPEIKIVDVFVCKIRKKLKPFGVAIDTVWALGYRLTPENKKKVAEYLATEGREEDAA
jgi:two-component system cell cycle response regulator CtrA